MDEVRCDVLVIGAGPAGSACAMTLAARGCAVVMVDQHTFPRDKVCGDALIPDAIQALRRLGVLEQVLAEAWKPQQVRCIAPSGRSVDFGATLAVLPRRRLDLLLVEAAINRGARFLSGLRFVQPVEAAAVGGRVVGADFQPSDQRNAHLHPVERVRARHTVLATGASTASLLAAGMATRREASAMAARLYVQWDSRRNDHDTASQGGALQVIWNKGLSPGYGWIFPGPRGVYNLGVGTFQSQPNADPKARNLREMFTGFVAGNAVAHRLLQEGSVLGRLKGAPLRSTLGGARWWRPGMLVCGEAAGSTYDFTGEGIGKALETGMLAAEAIVAGMSRQGAGEDPGPAYAASLEGLQTRFELYQRGNLINRSPWIAEVLVGLARASPRLRTRMGLLLEEKITPDALLSAMGLLRMMCARNLQG